jgi:hypothetical protein
MSKLIQWQDSTIEVQARLVPRYLWCTASIEVLLDGRCLLQTGGQMKFTGTEVATFTHAGSKHTARLLWGAGFLRSFPYSLRIDDAPVSEARVYIRNWPMGLVAVAVVSSMVLAAIVAALHFVRSK